MSKELQLSPLVVRRKLQDALFLFKLITGVIKCPELLQKINFRVPSGTRSQELFWRNHHPTSYDWNCSLARIQRVGYAISSSVDFFNSSLPAFRKKISDEKRDEGGDYQKSERVVFQQFVTRVRDANFLCGVTCFNNSPANRTASNISLNIVVVCTN
ncbi:hypothetical protein J6590_023768 [Homalodisca vitripennis]|nr:hypothetical protein J6590_023768 [Homalodisca vitripennis]